MYNIKTKFLILYLLLNIQYSKFKVKKNVFIGNKNIFFWKYLQNKFDIVEFKIVLFYVLFKKWK